MSEESEFMTVALATRLNETVDFIAIRVLAEHWITKRKDALVTDQEETSTATIRGEIKALRQFQKLGETVERILSDPKNKV